VTFAPKTILDVRAFLSGKTGLSGSALGIVGDAAHVTTGVSYHLGADQLHSDAYSIRLTRDKAGLSNAASALDIGNFSGLRNLSKFLVSYCQTAGLTNDIREIIYSPDGIAVLRWDRERGFNSAPRAESGLSISHRKHTHVSWYRDSEFHSKLAPFQAFWEVGIDMDVTATVRERWHPTHNATTGLSNGVLRGKADRNAPVLYRISEDSHIVTVAEIRTIAGNDGNFRLVDPESIDLSREPLYALRSDWISSGFVDCHGEPVIVSVNGSQVYP
jgi:hypothetical protein